MGKLKKWKSRALAIATLFCMMAMMMPGSAVAAGTFTDTSGHWAKDTIESWVEQGFVSGYPDDTFKPDQNITRAEFMTLVNKAFGFTKTTPASYIDVEAGAWYQKTVAVAKAAEYISGYPDSTMRPDNPISREEAASIIMRLKNLDPDQQAASQFSDAAKITWSKGAVGAVAEAGIMKGYPDGSFQPLRFITRAEAIVALDTALEYSAADPDAPAEPEEPVTPKAPAVTANDATNKVDGMTTDMEYKLDDGKWISYDAEKFAKLDLSGKHTLLVRYAAEGNNPAGPSTTLKFTSPGGGGGSVAKALSIIDITAPNATTVNFTSDVAGAIIIWNGEELRDVTTVIGENTITVPEMTSVEPNTLTVKKANYKTFTANDVIWYAPPVISNVKIASNNAKGPNVAWNGDIITLTFTANEPVEKLTNFRINSSNPDTFTSDGNNNYTATHLVDSGDPVTGQPVTFQINVKNEHGIYSQTIEATTDASSVMIIGLAELVPTGTAGVNDGKVYAGYKFMFDEEQISLAADNINIMVVLEPGQTIGKALTPDADPLLWFNVEKAAGEYLYVVETIEGKPYTATLAWTAPEAATLAPTGAAGEHEGINYAEHQMLDANSQAISLAEGAAALIAQRNSAGDWVALEPNTDTTLWFNQARPTFNYEFIVVNAEGVYHATLDWIVYVDQVVNGGFETGNFEGWLVHRSGIFPQVQSGTTYEGDYASFMGDGAEDLSSGGGTASIAQYLSIADNASTPYLDLKYQVVGTDSRGVGYDWMKVYINGDQIADWWSDTDGWQNFNYDLTAYKGQNIELKIVSWTSDVTLPANYYVDKISIYYETIEITSFDAIEDVDGGNAEAVTYADAAAVIAYLNANVTAVTITGTTDTVPVSNWTETDTYAAAEGSYTFTATVGALPDGYVDAVDPITTVTVEVVIAPAPLGTDASLSALAYNMTPVPGFDADTLTYSISLPAGTTQVPSINYTKSDSYASVLVNDATSLPGTTNVVVTAEDGITTRTYTINFTVEDTEITGYDAIADVDGGTEGAATYADAAAVIAYLNANVTAVTITGTTDTVPISSWTETDTYAAAEGSYTFTATVGTLPDGYIDATDPVTTVTVEVVIAAAAPPLSADASLTALGYFIGETFTPVTGFASDILTYNVTLPAGTTVAPGIGCTRSHINASAHLTPASSLPGTATVVVTAEDGITKRTYTINFTVEAADLDLTGAAINVAAGTITGTTTAMEYSLDSMDGDKGTWADCTAGSTTVTFDEGAVYVREKARPANFRLLGTIASAAEAPVSGVTYNIAAQTVTGLGATYEYSLNGGAWTTTASGVAFTAGPVTVRTKATTTALASAAQTIGTIAPAPDAPPAPTATTTITYYYIALVANAAHEFSIDDGVTWQADRIFQNLNHNTTYYFKARVKATATTLASEASPAAAITTKISASTDIKINGVNQGSMYITGAEGKTVAEFLSTVTSKDGSTQQYYIWPDGFTPSNSDFASGALPPEEIIISSDTLWVLSEAWVPGDDSGTYRNYYIVS